MEQKQLAKARSLADRWSELTRKIELWVEIQELNEQGEYTPVEVVVKPDTLTGNYFISFSCTLNFNINLHFHMLSFYVYFYFFY